MDGVQLRFAQIVKVWPQRRTAEVVFCDDGWRVADVPILNMHVTSDTGGWACHDVPRPPTEHVAGGLQPSQSDRTSLAVVAMVAGRPLILGYQPHPLTQMAFVEDQANRDIWRHPAGTYSTIAPDGSVEIYHSGGAFVRIGSGEDHEDLTPLAANGNWQLPDNDPATITVVTKGFKMVVRPGGDTIITSDGSLSIDYAKNIAVHAGGDISVRADGRATVAIAGAADVTVGGDLTAHTDGQATVSTGGNATVNVGGDLTASYAHATLTGDATLNGSLHVTGQVNADGDVTGGPISLIHHLTSGVRAGPDLSGPPV